MKIWLDAILLLIISSPIWFEFINMLGNTMRFRIVEKYNVYGYYYYIIEQYRWFHWKRSREYSLHHTFESCKAAEDALEDWNLSITTNHVILERTF